jgi:hypothetical protein
MSQVHSPTNVQAWTGADLDEDRWSVRIDPAIGTRLAELAAGQRDVPLGEVDDAPVRDLLADLAERCVDRLYGADGTGFAIVRGLPVAGVDEETVARIYWLLGLQLGTPVTQSKASDLLGHVRRELNASVHRGYKSSADLGYHSDMTPLAGLLCRIQAPGGGESTLVSGIQLYNVLLAERPDLLEVCFGEFPFSRLEENNPDEPPYLMQPIFAEKDGRLGIFYGRPLITHAVKMGAPELTPIQVEALDYLDQIANRPGQAFNQLLQPGDLLWLNNYSVLHGRSNFTDDPNPDRRRHLLRLWLDLPEERLAAVPTAMRYEFHYGNTGRSVREVAAAS